MLIVIESIRYHIFLVQFDTILTCNSPNPVDMLNGMLLKYITEYYSHGKFCWNFSWFQGNVCLLYGFRTLSLTLNNLFVYKELITRIDFIDFLNAIFHELFLTC